MEYYDKWSSSLPIRQRGREVACCLAEYFSLIVWAATGWHFWCRGTLLGAWRGRRGLGDGIFRSPLSPPRIRNCGKANALCSQALLTWSGDKSAELFHLTVPFVRKSARIRIMASITFRKHLGKRKSRRVGLRIFQHFGVFPIGLYFYIESHQLYCISKPSHNRRKKSFSPPPSAPPPCLPAALVLSEGAADHRDPGRASRRRTSQRCQGSCLRVPRRKGRLRKCHVP